MEFISYAASLMATVLGLCEPFNKKMKNVIIFSFLGNFLISVSYVIVGGYSGALICFLACLQLIVNYCYTSKGKKVPLAAIIGHALSFTVVNIITLKAWYDVVTLIAALVFVLSMSRSNAKYYRMLFVLNSTLWIIYDILAGAYGNLFTHVVLFLAAVISVLVRNRKKKNKVEAA
ncbi:MAG: YgjV family protein [Ruminococcaceae bacterium]|nr:YgjV family protein [Oscillospiraceae bacterium]